MLQKIADLLARLDADRIRYCHWKSNWVLDVTLEGGTDLDLLVDRADGVAFREAVAAVGFRPAVEHGSPPLPSVAHYHALDDSGSLVHVHAYYRIISGDSLAKAFHLPLEPLLLESSERVGSVSIPSRGAELVIFTLRMSIKHASLTELALLLRNWKNVEREAAWLATAEARAEAMRLVPIWLPQVDPELFAAAVEALTLSAALPRRVLLARRLRAQLCPFERHGRTRASLMRSRKFAGATLLRLRGSHRRLAPATGGAVIAFVGAEATGKSTMLRAVERWLDAHYTVRCIHAGKPPSTLLTAAPNLLLPALRAILPRQRSTAVTRRLDESGGAGRARFPLLFGIRSILLAHDRWALLRRAFAAAANGTIVLCDRYPSLEGSAVDGPQLEIEEGPRMQGPLRRSLVRLERRLYRTIPPADLVIRLTAPLDVTVDRNRNREKSEPEDYVISRRERSSKGSFGRACVVTVDTNRPLEESIGDVRRIIWGTL